MVIGKLRQWWWRKSYKKFYRQPTLREDPFALNAGTPERFSTLVQELMAMLRPATDDIVLDLGGGNGRLSEALFHGCRRVIVTDFSEAALRSARQVLPAHFSCVVAQMGRLPLKPAGLFTKIFTYSTFPHLGSERWVKRMLAAWDPLLARGGLLYLGDIPDRRAFGSIVRRALRRLNSVNGVKYFAAILLNSYFSRRRLSTLLTTWGYDVTVLDQSPERRFAAERFDLLARKPLR